VAGQLDDVLDKLAAIRQSGAQIEALMKAYPDAPELHEAGAAAIEKIAAWDGQIIQVLHQTYEDEDAWETMLAGQLRYLMDVIDETGAPVTGGAMLRLQHLQAEWAERQAELNTIQTSYIDVINEWARDNGVPHIN
jgi:hypothetical protein